MMKNIIFLIISIFTIASLSAQETKKIKKEKSVSVNVNKESDADRHIKIVTEKDGVEHVIEWTDQGEIPAEVMEKLETEGIDIEMLEGDGENIFIEIDGDEVKHKKEIKIKKKIKGSEGDKMIWNSEDGDVHIIRDKEVKVIVLGEDGNEKIIEWDGEGEMPIELKEHMEDVDIEFENDMEGHRRIRMHRGGDHDVRIMKDSGGERDRNIFFSEANRIKGERQAKVFVGARVEGHEKGASVVEVMEDSPAAKAKLMKGDVITKINGAHTRSVDGFMDLLYHFDVGDKISMTVIRGGKMMDLDLTLKSRPEDFK